MKNRSGAFTDIFEYSYDYLNRRIRKVDYLDFTGERYEYQIPRGGAAVATITDADGLAGTQQPSTLKDVNLYGAAVDEILAVDDGSDVQWSLADHEGSVRDILDDTGSLVEHRDYTAYGEISRFNPDGTPDTTALDFVFAFTGREWDDDVNLANHRARWYDPQAARFINQDPSGFAGGDANLYRYAGNNPVIFVDPSGLCRQGSNPHSSPFLNWNSSAPPIEHIMAGLGGLSAPGGYDSPFLNSDFLNSSPSVANSTPVNLGFESPFTSLTSTTLDLLPADLDLADADLSLVHNDWGPSGSHALLEPKPIYTPAYQLPDEYLNPRVVRTYYETSIWDDYDAVKEHVESTWFGWALTRLPGFQLGESVVRAALPRSEPTRVNVMSDGTKNYKVTKGPSTQALIDQASLILPVLKLPRVTPKSTSGLLQKGATPVQYVDDIGRGVPSSSTSTARPWWQSKKAPNAAQEAWKESRRAERTVKNGRLLESPKVADPLKGGLDFEAQQLSVLGRPKNTKVWRPPVEQTESAAFKVIVGEAKYTKGGQLTGTILDATEAGYLEIKGGTSVLDSSYQLRLQTYKSLIDDTPYTIRTTRPVNATFSKWLQRWGVKVERVK